MENPKVQENFNKVMRSFDKVDESMNRVFNAIYFLYGAFVMGIIIMLIEAFTS